MSGTFEFEGLNPQYAFLPAQVELVGERDPQQVLEETGELLEALVREVPADRFRQRPEHGKWSPNEILGHLADCEWGFGFRLRTIFADESPSLAPFDQDRWVDVQCHRSREPQELLAAFQALRPQNLLAWSRIDARTKRERSAPHPEAGIPYTLELLHYIHAGHDLAHLAQIIRALERIERAG